jgi:RNA polymerase sigma factor (sigma-70 family)
LPKNEPGSSFDKFLTNGSDSTLVYFGNSRCDSLRGARDITDPAQKSVGGRSISGCVGICGIRMESGTRPTRYSSLSLPELICLCAGPCDDGAWKEFVARVGKAISLTILRTASLWGEPSRALVEDLVQVTYLKLWEDTCRSVRDFAIHHPETFLAYLRKVATNATHDHFRHCRNQSSGGIHPHVSTNDHDVEAGQDVRGSQDRIAFQILLNQIDERLKCYLAGPDQERDRTIFWLYFRQGMSTKEIASLPTIGLGPKGVGSVIERLKRYIREQIAGSPSPSGDESGAPKSKIAQEFVIGLYGSQEYGTSMR